jgi:thiamine pyrophosphokinase
VALVVTNGTITLPKSSGKYFSVFAFGGEAHGVSIKNARYEIENVSLTPDFPLGVSNEFRDTPPTISVNFGSLLVIFENF